MPPKAMAASASASSYTQEQINAILAENKALKAKQEEAQKIRFKVSEKGALSVYGLNARFPVTLYRQQWERLLAKSAELTAFIKANESNLTTKE